MSNIIKITAEEVKTTNFQNHDIYINVRDICKFIEACIIDAKIESRQECIVDLPYIFDIANMDNVEARVAVYARLLNELKKNGFTATINKKSKNKYILTIRWD